MNEQGVQYRRRQLGRLLPDHQAGLAESQLVEATVSSFGPQENADEDSTVYSVMFVNRSFRMLAMQSRL